MTSAINPALPTSGEAFTADVRSNFQAAANEITALQAAGGAVFGAPGYTGGSEAPAGTIGEIIFGNLSINPLVNGQDNPFNASVAIPAGVWTVYGTFMSGAAITPAAASLLVGGVLQCTISGSDGTTASVYVVPPMADSTHLSVNSPTPPLLLNFSAPGTVVATCFSMLDPNFSFSPPFAAMSCQLRAVRTG